MKTILTGHKKNCTWITPLPDSEGDCPSYWGCNCGYNEWYLENEDELDKEVMIIDRLEHGNGGVYGFMVLEKLPLLDAFTKFPGNYGIYNKEFGFYPVINNKLDINDYLYRWDENSECWKEA